MSDRNECSSPSALISRRAFVVGAAAAAAALSCGLITESACAGGLFPMPSPADQKKVGDEAAGQIVKQYHEIYDRRAKHFQALGETLVKALPADDQKWDFRFHVLESKEINAFALPGGNMFMFTGLYEKIPTEDALAAVTGHEMTHVRLQHWAKAYVKQQERNAIFAIGLSLFHAGSATQTVAQLANNAISLKYSRSEEQQADAGGLQNMVDAGFNPQGMVQLFQVLQKVAGNGGTLGTDFLSNHPLTSDRIKAAQQGIAKISAGRTFPPLTPLDYAALLPSREHRSNMSPLPPETPDSSSGHPAAFPPF
jgi:predicted Zn-dependent protease